ncbi:putative chemotaxis transducer [Shewanella benthica]|uniref:Putative chemotaxis transducer n=1 Tax=Shewanella benthica TaxID=43661 RepID=A0A330M854_9GAMM|nr:methyl-accepting chemotaxis protein [Shewanella benthica]SQH77190.1 putative chemotaxis transducer [Shewanella benthica]
MNIIRKLLQAMGFKSISAQLLMLNIILALSGFSAMAIIYNDMQADAATINIAGRQRMLSQLVAKEVLLVQFGVGQDTGVKNAIELFESSMNMLINGDTKRGISAPMTPEIKSRLGKVNKLWSKYREGIQALLLLGDKDQHNEKLSHLIGELHQRAPILLKEMNQVVLMMETASNASATSKMQLILGLIFLLMLLSGILYLYVHKYLLTPLLPLREGLQKIAKGDLTKRLPADDNDDEMGALYRDYNEARNDFSDMLLNVVRTSEQLSVSSLQLKGAATENAISMDQQYQEIELISTAMNEITATIQEVAVSSAHASDYTERAEQEANRGREVMGGAATTIDKLNQQVQAVGAVIHTLDADSQEISTVLDVISSIADQTNLLALNAAIEAARAGEAGRGFAVVADEVRGLAARTAKSTSEIQQMVEKLQSQVQQAVQAISAGQKQASIGVKHVQEADDALERIVEAVVAINEMNAHIATASREQSCVAEEMNQRIVHVADASQKTRDNASNNQELADNLSQMGEQLRNYTVGFRV